MTDTPTQAPAPKPTTGLTVSATKSALGLITYYNSIFADRGFVLPPHLVDVARALADDRIRKLMIIIGPGSGKSLMLSVCYPSWLLGIESSQTILGVSAGEALIQGFMSAVMQIIEWSPIYHGIFPKTRPDKSTGWSTERGLFVTGHMPGDPDASYFASGLESSSITGKHGRTLILDDLHNKQNSASTDQCLKVVDAYYNTLIGRADPRGARFIVAGRRWNTEDIYGHLRDEGDFVTMVLPAERQESKELWWDITVPDGLECVFTEKRAA